jgi:hypothetical protein
MLFLLWLTARLLTRLLVIPNSDDGIKDLEILVLPSRNSAGYQRLLAAVETANPAGTIVVITDNLMRATGSV